MCLMKQTWLLCFLLMTISMLITIFIMNSTSCVPPNYMDRQPDINEKMRAILVDWLIEVILQALLISYSR